MAAERCKRCGTNRADHILPALYCPNPARPFDLWLPASTDGSTTGGVV